MLSDSLTSMPAFDLNAFALAFADYAVAHPLVVGGTVWIALVAVAFGVMGRRSSERRAAQIRREQQYLRAQLDAMMRASQRKG